MADSGRLSQRESDRLGLPIGFERNSPYPFGGLNQEDDRIALQDNEWFWTENYIRQGAGLMRTLWDKGTALYSAPPNLTIVSFFWFNIGTTLSCAVFLSDGSGVQVGTDGSTVVMGDAGTFHQSGASLPACTQFGTQYLLISNNFSANDYWVWDGRILCEAGTISPAVDIISGGSGYSSAPTVTAYGGSGSGITATSTVTNGVVTSVTITNPGRNYGPTDVVGFAFSGGGSDNGAILSVTLGSGSINAVIVTDPGSGYTSSPSVSFSGGGGSGATAFSDISGGAVISVTVTCGGSGFTSSPSVSFSGGSGSGAAAVVQFSAGKVGSVSVVSGGSGFTGSPVVTFQGGGGSGAKAVANVSGGAVVSVTVTNHGSGYITAPTAFVTPGSNQAASAQARMMPFGVSGEALDTFQNCVWLVNPYSVTSGQNLGTILKSAPSSFTDFSTANGGLIYTSNDPFLRQKYTGIKQSNGYLYVFGDSSVDVISNVQTGGSPTVTTFNYQNVDPQSGLAWRDTAQYFGLSVLFANLVAANGLYGGAVKKISKKVTKLFDDAIFPPSSGGVTPSGAIANIHTIKCYLLLMTVLDPFSGLPRTVMLGWDEENWFVATQTLNLTYISPQVLNSKYTAYGTDGRSLYPLFNVASKSLPKIVSTKLYGAQTSPVIKLQDLVYISTKDKSSDQSGVSFNVFVDSENGSIPPQAGGDSLNPIVMGTAPQTAFLGGDIYGTTLGLTLSSNSADFILKHLVTAYRNVWGGRGDMPQELADQAAESSL